MGRVVMQAAEFQTVREAERCETELEELCDAYARFEAHEPSPWSTDRVAPGHASRAR